MFGGGGRGEGKREKNWISSTKFKRSLQKAPFLARKIITRTARIVTISFPKPV